MPELDYSAYESSEVSAREVMQLLRRRRWTVLGTCALFILVAALLTPLMTPVYRAHATMLVEDPTLRPVRSDDSPLQPPGLDATEPFPLDTQVEVLLSGPLWQKVMERIGPIPRKAYPSCTVAQRSKTAIIEIDADSTDPRIARDVPNVLMEEYIKQTQADRGASLAQTRQFVERKLAEKEQELTGADARLRSFKERNHLTDLTADRDNAIKEADAAQDELRSGQNELSGLYGQIRQVRAQIRGESAVVQAGSTVIVNPQIATDQGKIQALELQRITLLRNLKPTEPEVTELDAQMARLKADLRRQPATVRSSTNFQANPLRASLQSQLDGLVSQARGLEPKVARLRRQSQQAGAQLQFFPAWETRLTSLQRARDQAQESVKDLSTTLGNLRIREQETTIAAKPLTPASLPLSPVRPRPAMNLLVASAFGLVFGIGAACLREMIDDRVHTAEDAERAAGLTVLGRVPLFPRRTPPLIGSTESPAKESYRRLRAQISFAGNSHPVRSLMVTSAAAGEGKSTTAANLAVAATLQGRTVILVDADLRNPSLHRLLDVKMRVGLSDVLEENASIEEALHATTHPGLLLLPAGELVSHAAELLAAPKMGELVQALRERADLVILDTPPCLPVADAEVLGTRVDAAVLVVGLGRTEKEAVRMARELLEQARVRLLGAVLNRMAPGDHGYCYSRYYRAPHGSADERLSNGAAALLPRSLEATEPAASRNEENVV